jgi:ABC-2 type transport system permease protein
MRTIYKIARFELNSMFFSPIAWLVLVAFILITGLQFFDLFDAFLLNGLLGRALPSLSERLYTNISYEGIWYYIQSRLYLFIPLITMNLLSREQQSGSIKLLFSSPVTIFEIVMGKFLAMMIFALMLVLTLFLFVITGSITIQSLDVKFLISGLIGLYLLICAYSAIGLFMSSLTSYQVVAAISTLAILGALSYIGGVGQQFALVRAITYFISINGRTENFIHGLITSRDIIYFLIVTSIFLGLAILRLLSKRESKSPWLVFGRYTILIVAALLIGYFSSMSNLTGYYDMTLTKTQTLTPASQKIVKNVTGPLSITGYVNILDEHYYYLLPDQGNGERTRFEQYQRYLPPIKMNYVYYYAHSMDEDLYTNPANKGLNDYQIAKKTALLRHLDFRKVLSPEQIGKSVDLSAEEYRTVWQLKAGNKTAFLRLYNDMFTVPFEQEITAALSRLVTPVPRVVFISGHGERDIKRGGDKDYKLLAKGNTFRNSLINQGFDVQQISLAENSIPKNIAALVIADPQKSFGTAELKKLQDYIAGGNNLIIAGEPGKQEILNPLTLPLGVQFIKGRILEKSKDYAPDFVLSEFTKDTYDILDKDRIFLAKDGLVSTNGATALSYRSGGQYIATPVLVIDPRVSWLSQTASDTSGTHLQYRPESGDQKGSLPTAISLTRKIHNKEQRIVVLGDADLFSNAEITRDAPRTENLAFSLQLFRWMTYGKYPVNTSRPTSPDRQYLIGQNDTIVYKIAILGIIPGLLIILASVLLIRRQRR